MTTLTITRDKNSIPQWGTSLSDDIFNAVMNADTDTSLAVPADANLAMITADGDFYYSSGPFALPTGAAFASGKQLLNPTLIQNLDGITTMHFRSTNVRRISVAFFTGSR